MSSINIQDFFLEQAKAKNYVVTVHLVGKVRLMGTIKEYDQFSVTLSSYGQDQLIYKQAISTIQLPRGKHTSFIFAKEDGKTVVKTIPAKTLSPASSSAKPRPSRERNHEGSSSREQRESKGRPYDREQRPYEQRKPYQQREFRQGDPESRPYESRASQPRSLRSSRPYGRRDGSN